MNEIEFQEWTEELAELRKSRHDWIVDQVKINKMTFSCHDLFQELSRSLGEIIDRWWQKEQSSQQIVGKSLSANDLDQFKNEIDGLIQFELSTIDDDIVYATGQIPWDKNDVAKEKDDLAKFSEQLKSSYYIKIDSFILKKDSVTSGFDPFPRQQNEFIPRTSSGGPSSTKSWALVSVFIVGLLLGSGVSFYIWQSSTSEKSALFEELAAVKAKNGQLEESVKNYQRSLLLIAQGKMRSLSEIEKQISFIQSRYQKLKSATKDPNVLERLEENEGNELRPFIDQLEALKKGIAE